MEPILRQCMSLQEPHHPTTLPPIAPPPHHPITPPLPAPRRQAAAASAAQWLWERPVGTASLLPPAVKHTGLHFTA